jgi:hypothetical protein
LGVFHAEQPNVSALRRSSSDPTSANPAGDRGARTFSSAPPSDSHRDLTDFDVPAVVVCARCGDPECAGCEPSELSQSGIVTIVPWERTGPGASGVFARLWATARLTTYEADGFFSVLPDGPLAPALRFALLAETVAATTAVLPFTGLFFLLPGVSGRFFEDPTFRGFVARSVFLAISGLALTLVAAHAAHGASLELGARRAGVSGSWTRAVRFGLYAAGWDVVVGVVGMLVGLAQRGPKGAAAAVFAARGLPTRSALSFLSATAGLVGEQTKAPLRLSYLVAGAVTVLAALGICGAVAAALL